MSGIHPKSMRQADTTADPFVEHALNQGYLDSDAAYDMPGAPGHEAAVKAMHSVCRSVRRRNLSPAAWIADESGIPCAEGACADPDASHMVRFKLWSKDKARGHVFRESAGDPGNLKYNPWAAGRNRHYSDSGEP